MEVNMTPGEKKYVHVEVCVKQESVADYQHVREVVFTFLNNSSRVFMHGLVAFGEDTFLAEHIEAIVIADLEDCAEDELEDGDGGGIPHSEAELLIHVFKLSDEPPAEQTTDDDENVSTCQELVLPSLALNGLWETLIYEAAVKRNVLDYATTAMLFSDSKVNPHIISWNRVVLLHGPPGTGKTSLCKALAQKLSIRLSERFPNAFLIEINAHSLFSKWFSESGKLVMKLFRQIQELVEDDESLVCVLIDEVESLTAARKAALSGSEPSDAIRVVNALLTQLDSLKSYSNVLILTTSNITEAIDVAFVDRADIKQYIGLPSTHARYEILRSCVEELERVRIIQHSSFPILPYSNLMRRRASKKRLADQMNSSDRATDQELALSSALLQVAEMAEGFSGRALRKLPFQAHAFFVHGRSPHAMEFLRNVVRAVEVENESKKRVFSA